MPVLCRKLWSGPGVGEWEFSPVGRLCIVSVLVYLLVKGEGNIELYAVDLINILVKDVLKQCYLGERKGRDAL